MKIDYLEIRSRFKNLENVTIDFDETHLMTVIVGWNGAGKSNIIEALVSIFRNLDLGETPKFSYKIKFRLKNDSQSNTAATWIIIDADPDRGKGPGTQHTIRACSEDKAESLAEEKWQKIPFSKVKRDKQGRSLFLPRYLFAYYSGPSDRLEEYFKKHRTDFYRRLLRNELTLKGEIRPLFYAKPIHSQFVLLAFFLGASKNTELDFLREHLGIEGLDSVHFVLRRPDWAKKKKELFWGADGVVREFLDRLFPHTLAPVKVTRQEDLGLTGKSLQNEFFHLFVPGLQELRDAANGLTPDELFKMLESLLLSEIIAEVRVRVKVRGIKNPLSFKELSEGEQQLLTVLGLLKFTGGQDSLFLLDEPDTHLNPSWTVEYLSFLKQFISDQDTSHMIMVTHHPLAIAELAKRQVIIMWRDREGIIHAEEPETDPRGMGFAGILTSDMFGLTSTLDRYSESLLRERRELIEKGQLTQQEHRTLEKLDKKIQKLGFTTSHWDHDYEEYLQIRKQQFHEIFVEDDRDDPEVKEKRKQRAEEIVRKILEQEKREEGNV